MNCALNPYEDIGDREEDHDRPPPELVFLAEKARRGSKEKGAGDSITVADVQVYLESVRGKPLPVEVPVEIGPRRVKVPVGQYAPFPVPQGAAASQLTAVEQFVTGNVDRIEVDGKGFRAWLSENRRDIAALGAASALGGIMAYGLAKGGVGGIGYHFPSLIDPLKPARVR